jgi:hypothetical protein
MRSSACDTLARLCVRHVLCWPAFPLVSALRSTAPPQLPPPRIAPQGAPLCSPYGEVRLPTPVHHRLRLLTFPMRTTVLTPHATAAARHETTSSTSCCSQNFMHRLSALPRCSDRVLTFAAIGKIRGEGEPACVEPAEPPLTRPIKTWNVNSERPRPQPRRKSANPRN